MNYNIHFKNNYRILKERMMEKNKGFWKVQSIHKLQLKLSQKFNAKDFIMLKTIQNNSDTKHSFITYSSDNKFPNLNKRRIIRIKGKSNNKPDTNLFITNENKKNLEETKIKYKERKKKLYSNLYKGFSYEPYLYNDVNFIYLKGQEGTIPRKFSEVLKDCLIMDKYNNYLNKFNIERIKTLNEKENKFGYGSIKLTDSNTDSFNKIKALIKENKKKNIKYFTSRFNHNIKINDINENLSNDSNTEYDGFYKNKRTRGIYTVSTFDIDKK